MRESAAASIRSATIRIGCCLRGQGNDIVPAVRYGWERGCEVRCFRTLFVPINQGVELWVHGSREMSAIAVLAALVLGTGLDQFHWRTCVRIQSRRLAGVAVDRAELG